MGSRALRAAMELLAGRCQLTCLEKHRRFRGLHRGLSMEVSECDGVMTLVFDSPTADLGEEAAKGFPTFRHCSQARVPSEWFASSQERSRNRCLMHITQRRLNLVGLAGFLEIPDLVARDFHEHGATESVPPEPREGGTADDGTPSGGGDASLEGEPAQQARPPEVTFGKPDLQWYLQLPFPLGWLFRRSLALLGMLAIILLASVGMLVSRLACSESPLHERAPQPPERESYNRGVAALQRGDYDASIADFIEAIRADPRDAEAYNNWGVALHRLGRPAEACEKYARATEINPRDALAFANWGAALGNLGRYAEECEKYAKAVEINPRDAKIYGNWGIALESLGRHEEACEKCAKSVESDPRYADAYVTWGTALASLGRCAEECEKYAKAVEIAPRHAVAYYNWGVALAKLGRLAVACEKYAKALEINPRYADALVNWGVELARLGRHAEACEKFAGAIEIDPRKANAYRAWGLALVLLGKRAEAEEKWNKAAELDPASKPQIEEMRKQLLGKE